MEIFNIIYAMKYRMYDPGYFSVSDNPLGFHITLHFYYLKINLYSTLSLYIIHFFFGFNMLESRLCDFRNFGQREINLYAYYKLHGDLIKDQFVETISFSVRPTPNFRLLGVPFDYYQGFM